MGKAYNKSEITYDQQKFKELMLLFAVKCKDHPLFGAIKLNKQFFWSDFLAYKELGKPITGAKYQALDWGPSPTPLIPIRQEMMDDREIELVVSGHQERVVARRKPDLSRFSKEELKIVYRVIRRLKERDWRETSDGSHEFIGWKAAQAEREATGQRVYIPYGTIHITTKRPSRKQWALGRELATKYEWSV